MKTQNNPSIPNGKFQAASKPTSHSVGQALWESGLGVESSIEPKKKSNISVCPRKPQLSQWGAPAWVLPIRVVKPLAFISFLAWPWFEGMNSGKVGLCSPDRSWRSWQLGKVLPWRGVIDFPPIIPILQPCLDFSTFSNLTEHFPTS